jgi:hypothetical protein
MPDSGALCPLAFQLLRCLLGSAHPNGSLTHGEIEKGD